MWMLFRLFVVEAASWSVVAISKTNSNIDWLACALISAAFGIALFTWLTVTDGRGGIDWSEPLSLTKPFYPMVTYPVRYWLLAAMALLLGGTAAAFLAMRTDEGRLRTSATFFFSGVAIVGALAAAKARHNWR
jgi:uncharacterized membrane-anchored protein